RLLMQVAANAINGMQTVTHVFEQSKADAIIDVARELTRQLEKSIASVEHENLIKERTVFYYHNPDLWNREVSCEEVLGWCDKPIGDFIQALSELLSPAESAALRAGTALDAGVRP